MSLLQAPTSPSLLLPLVIPNHHTINICVSPISPNRNTTFRRGTRRTTNIFCSGAGEAEAEEAKEEASVSSWLRPWDVPWDWKVTACVMMPYLLSAAFARFAGSPGLEGEFQPDSNEALFQLHSPDEVAMHMFADQLLKFVAKLVVLYMFVSPHRPFPDDVFSLRFDRPFNLTNGWLLWASGGIIICSFVVLVKLLVFASSGSQTPNQAELLVRLLPLIGSSNVSTMCLLGMSGILAPICEEMLYRGFFMTSLTKWFPLPMSLILSSAAFAIAHQSPGRTLDIFIFGTILGATYAQTRNLLAPITMHALWNSGVILALTYFHSQGEDIQKYIL